MRPAKGNSPGEAAELPKRSYKCGNLAAAAAMQLTRGWDAPLQESIVQNVGLSEFYVPRHPRVNPVNPAQTCRDR